MRFLFILFFLFGCSNLEFVYDKYSKNILKNSTSLILTGDKKDIVYSQLVNLIGQNVEKIYILEVDVKEVISKEIISPDSTTSKYNVSHTIKYSLISTNKRCSLLERKITTSANYNSKSAGYNFGTDVSKTKTIEGNILNNIENFLKTVSVLSNTELCNNEG